ncbi:hypothetical protein YDYSY3_38590 [Paenibacillus chitinolyticus]|uniref:hypothetical protein n=1 Tax=Paenibacillus chitinolyticus TaxID=79263 RepID=UPI0026E4BAF7|nr:hypothetical protein [Paenibacillus chitinolyticus]GKS12859.1 hypothetical protein YDYSY3_38590 [Paenibacillus chitinolyticus]
MKKVIATLITVIMMFSTASSAFAAGVTSGWQTKKNTTVRVSTDQATYGPGTSNINVTIDKSAPSTSYFYEIFLAQGTQYLYSTNIRGWIGTSSKSHDIKISDFVPTNSQATFEVMVKIYTSDEGYPFGTYIGDWFTPSFTVVRTN